MFRDADHEKRFYEAVNALNHKQAVPACEAACLYVLTANDENWRRMEPHVNLTYQQVDFETIRRIPWGSGQTVLMGLANRLWNSEGEFDVEDLWMYLDDRNWQLAINALQIRRHGLSEWLAAPQA